MTHLIVFLVVMAPTAARVVVVSAEENDSGARALAQTLSQELLGLEVPVHQQALPASHDAAALSRYLAGVARDKGAEVVATNIQSSRRTRRTGQLIVVAATGETIFHKKTGAQTRSVSLRAARAIGEYLDERSAAAHNRGEGDAAWESDETATDDGSARDAAHGNNDLRVEERDRAGWNLRAWLGVGGAGFVDRVAGQSTRVSPTPQNTVLLEVEPTHWLHTDLRLDRYSTDLSVVQRDRNAQHVRGDMNDFAATVGVRFPARSARLLLMAGAGYQSLTATADDFPATSRLMARLGARLDWDLSTPGLSAQVALYAIPWGNHHEAAGALAIGSETGRLFGMGARGRVIYEMPDLFGSAGGLVFSAEAGGELLGVQYSGVSPWDPSGATSSRGSRLSYATLFSAGYRLDERSVKNR